jgi:ubiquinone/menaquinone biosynthesis C-methylase UbiE
MDLPDEVDAYARADFAEVNRRFVARLIELAAGLDDARACDLGTGPGDIPIRVAKAKPDWAISAVDASAPMLDVARAAIASAGLSKNISLVLADAKDTKLPAASFDVILSNSILHHVADPLAFWREVKRIAKPGALIFIRDLFRPESEAAARAIVAQNAGGETALLQEEFYRSLLAAYTPGEVREQLAQTGLAGLNVGAVSDRHMDAWGTL